MGNTRIGKQYFVHFLEVIIHVLGPSAGQKIENDRYFDRDMWILLPVGAALLGA